jgi:hypothetical protein
MMSDEQLRWVVAGVILVHGIAHGGALGALWWVGTRGAANAGGWAPARSWLAPSLGEDAATRLAVAFWVASVVGFVLAALAFLGIVLPVDAWPALGAGSAVVSTVGIVLFVGTWPAFNTVAALAVNVAVVVAAVTGWPPSAVLGA